MSAVGVSLWNEFEGYTWAQLIAGMAEQNSS